MTHDYRFEPLALDRQGFESVSALLRLVFPRARHLTPRYLEWLFAHNPDGIAVGCNAYSGDELVGHMAAMPIVGRIEGEVRPGLFTINGAVHPGHRGRRLQSRISASIFDQAADRGFGFCFATGNKWSTGPLLTRFNMVRPLDARIGLGWPRREAKPARPSFERVWSDEALRWRLANPEGDYSVERHRDALAIAAPSGRLGIGAILYQGPGDPGLATRGAAPGPVRVWLGLDPGVDWRRSAFLPIPMRLRPSPLNLVFKDLTDAGDFVPDPDRLVFRGLDFDPF